MDDNIFTHSFGEKNGQNHGKYWIHVSSLHQIGGRYVWLVTVPQHVKKGNLIKCRALLDNGSQSNFMTRNFFNKLNVKSSKLNISVSGINQMSSPISDKVHCVIKSTHNNFTIDLNFLIIDRITENIPQISIDYNSLEIPSELSLADPKFYISSPIDVLLGANIFWNLKTVYWVSQKIRQLSDFMRLNVNYKTIRTSYIDDAINLKRDLEHVLSGAGFLLRKWTSNSPEVLQNSNNNDQNYIISEDEKIKTLGMSWSSKNDIFYFSLNKDIQHSDLKFTKRIILSTVARIYDPLGLISCVIIIAKCMLQALWKNNLGWDDVLPPDFKKSWEMFFSQLPMLNQLKIPRQITCKNVLNTQLHGYSDSSETAYGASLLVGLNTTNCRDIFELFSEFSTLQRSVAYCLRFLRHIKQRDTEYPHDNLTTNELNEATLKLMKLVLQLPGPYSDHRAEVVFFPL
ncbi:hypothetical protein NQ317_015658 [Molorchus minor]|uniref:Peptidase aspartic putative domain-containing protein n=1 Tax=Molorchus minor TaxID=1323400 RepID=A0ABQ9JLA1_9CUCU|nr:hypothetical protein NQ317_015658 [Molorchus minor]